MNIENITIAEARQVAAMFSASQPELLVTNNGPYEVGKNYFIRTVTHHLTGKLVEVYANELVLIDAAWIADDGKFTTAMRDETFHEVEIYPEGKRVIVGRTSVIDATTITQLPRSEK